MAEARQELGERLFPLVFGITQDLMILVIARKSVKLFMIPTLPHETGPAVSLDVWSREEDSPRPLGATWGESVQAYNLALYSKGATSVSLLLYGDRDFTEPLKVCPFVFPANKTSRIWRILVPTAEIEEAKYYAFKIDAICQFASQ